jgi:hypothetical protein
VAGRQLRICPRVRADARPGLLPEFADIHNDLVGLRVSAVGHEPKD